MLFSRGCAGEALRDMREQVVREIQSATREGGKEVAQGAKKAIGATLAVPSAEEQATCRDQVISTFDPKINAAASDSEKKELQRAENAALKQCSVPKSEQPEWMQKIEIGIIDRATTRAAAAASGEATKGIK